MAQNNIDYTIRIALLLREKYPFDNAMFNMYNKDDIYNKIPSFWFRLDKNADVKIYDEIKKIVESFNGNLKWTIFQCSVSRFGNRLFSPYELYDFEVNYTRKGIVTTAKKVIPEDKFKSICEKAIEDIPNLAKHIEEYLEKKK